MRTNLKPNVKVSKNFKIFFYCFLIVYLICSYLNLELDPFLWDKGDRLFSILLLTFLYLIIWFYSSCWDNEHHK